MLRKKKLGKVFLDIGKFAFTVGVIGRFISEDVSTVTMAGVLFIATVSLAVG